METKGQAGPDDLRQARMVLQALAGEDCWLAKEMLSDGPRWAVFVAAGDGARMLRQVSLPLVKQLRQKGLVEPMEDEAPLRWRISSGGRRWLELHAPGMASACRNMSAEEHRGDAERRAAAGRDGKTRRSRGQSAKRQNARREVRRLLVRDAETGALREVAVNMRESPLMWLARRRDASGRPYLEPHHVAAGERLRQDYETACMQPNITASWNPALVAADRGRLKSGPRDPFPFAERVMAARQHVHRALEHVGADLADIVVAVCCLGNGIEAAERALKWPRRSARLVLRIALERLADHYGLKPAGDSHAPRWQRSLHWHAADGRPTQLMPQQEQAADDQRLA